MPRADFDPSGSLSILGYDYAVLLATDDDEMDGYDGLHRSKRLEIIVRARLKDDAKRETLLHEILHAIDEAFDAEMSETQVLRLSRGLYAVCRENRDYFLRLLFPEAAARLAALPGVPVAAPTDDR